MSLVRQMLVLGALLPAMLLAGCEECPTFEACEGTDRDISDEDTHSDTDTEVDPGEEAYSGNCTGCHGADGISGYATDLPDVVPDLSESDLDDIITNGTGTMPAISMTADEQADVISYVIATFGG